MSIVRVTSVHCDGGCGTWDYDVASAAKRRKAGWRIWRIDDGYGPWRHLCPTCTVTHDGEVPPP